MSKCRRLGLVALVAMCGALGACESDGEGRSHDWRNNPEGVRPAEGGRYSGEGRGIKYLERDGRDQRPENQGGIREAKP